MANGTISVNSIVTFEAFEVCFTAWSCWMIDPGVLISDAIAAPASGQWLLLFACTSELILTKLWLLVIIQGRL